MKKQLLIITLTATFANATFAQEAPAFNHAEKLQFFIKYGESASNCPQISQELPILKAIMDNLQQRNKENGVVGFTAEEESYIENMDAQYNQHHRVSIENILSGKTQQEDTQESDTEKADQQ